MIHTRNVPEEYPPAGRKFAGAPQQTEGVELVTFAIILMTGDDIGGVLSPASQSRARQT